MPRYYWTDSDVILQADVKENLQYQFALLHPKAGLDAAALQAMPQKLQRHGLIATPDVDTEGAAVLRVRGFKTIAELSGILHKEQLIASSQPTRSEMLEEEKNPDVKTLRKYIKEHSIQIAGAFYLVADMVPIVSGIVRKTPAEVSQGLMWTTTSAALLLFGRKNPEVQMGNVYTRMKGFMAQEGLELNDDPALALEQLQRNPSYWNKMINFLYEHPVLFNNTLQGYGGMNQIQAGHAQGNPFKRAAGFGPMLGMWGGLIVPEDKYASLSPEDKAEKLRLRAQGEEPENGLNAKWYENPVAWVQEKPLRLSGVGPIIGNFLTAASALFHDRHEVNKHFGLGGNKFELSPSALMRDARRSTTDLLQQVGVSREALQQDRAKPVWQREHTQLDKMLSTQNGWRITMVGPLFNIIANTLYGMSSKEERSVDLNKAGYIDELLAVAANIYVHVPESQRGEKVMRFAGFLRSQPDINISEKEIRTRLEQKMQALEQSGWAAKVANENASPAASMSL